MRKILIFLVFAVLLVSCSTEDPFECITAFDCDEGFSCIDGFCVENSVGDTGNTGDSGDTGNTGNSGNTGDTGDTGDTAIPDEDSVTVDNETPDIVNDEIIEHDEDVNPQEDEDVIPDEDTAITCDSGYESNGTTCVDINECVKGTHNCHVNADCSNTEGSFNCTCKTNYSGTGINCTPDTRTNQVCSGLPENAQWNTAAVISQTWNGSGWVPSTTGAYNVDASLTECRFICKTNYGWNGSVCTAELRYDQACTGLPSNASWNTASSITQAWNGSTWLPTTTGVYNETPSDAECRFKCNPDYHWETSSCVSNTRANQTCTGLPANASWNTASSITQTWNGSSWTPSTAGTYNTTGSTTECRYQCSSNFYWNNLACVQCTDNAHCGGGTPYCNMSTYTCVQCTQNSQCNTGTGEVCLNNQCTNCVVQSWNFSNTSTGRTGTIQSWTVPSDGKYRITAYGAQGATSKGGLGAKMTGDFELTQNTVIKILVGQRGSEYQDYYDDNWYLGGGGGTFVVREGAVNESGIYVIAGGGGGSNDSGSSNRHGTTSTSGNSGEGSDHASGGTNGNGGGADGRGPGGGGFYTNGQEDGTSEGGYAYLNGGAGGNGEEDCEGGFGGGGAPDGSGFYDYGGGGGGYSGGGGGGGGGDFCGGGGGSYNSGTNQSNASGNRSGHGYVTITRVCE